MKEKRKKSAPLTARFTWKIENFSKLNTKKLYSQIFHVRGCKWRVLIFRKGNTNADHLSMYLDVADKATLPFGWGRDAKFSLSVINHIDNKLTVKKGTEHQFYAQESIWGFASFLPLAELYDLGRGYLVNDTLVVKVHFPSFRSGREKHKKSFLRSAHDLKEETGNVELRVEAGGKSIKKLRVEAAKTASGKGETPKSCSERDINGRIRSTASGTSGPPPASKSATKVIKTSARPTTPIVEKLEVAKTASGKGETPKSCSERDINGRIRSSGTSGPPPASKSATKVIKTPVPPTTPIVEKESKEVELRRSPPMDSPLESSSFDDMDAYISKLVSVVETDAPCDSTTEGSVAASIPQSATDEAKKFFIKMLSRDLSEIPGFGRHLTESICVLSKCCDLTPAQLAQLNTLKVEFPTLLKTYQISNHSLKEVQEKMAEKQGTKKCLVEQVKINAFAFQTQRAIHKDLITKESELQQEIERLLAEQTKISEKKKSAEKEIKELHGKMVNIEQSRSSVLEEISTLEAKKKTEESSVSSVQQKWNQLRHIFMEPIN